MNTSPEHQPEREDFRALVEEASIALDKSPNPLDRALRSWLRVYSFVLERETGEVSFRDAIAFIGTFTRNPEFLIHQQTMVDSSPGVRFSLRLPDEAKEWGIRFLYQVMREVRTIVCGRAKDRKGSRKVDAGYTKALAVSISTTVLNTLNVHDPATLGLATLILITLSQATKNAFCKMTDAEVLGAIGTKLRQEECRIAQQCGRAEPGNTAAVLNQKPRVKPPPPP